MATNSVRVRLLTTVPHLHFPLAFAHLGDERPGFWSSITFKDGTRLDVHSEQINPSMRGMIGGAARMAVKHWIEMQERRKLAQNHPGLRSLPPDELEAVLSYGMSDA